jgi:DNA-binding NarL/FixJ family response regulator
VARTATHALAVEPDSSDSPLVGRADEQALLDEALSDAARRRPSTVCVVGAPGLGKTRLVAETCIAAQRRGMLVLHGSAEQRGRGRLFAAVADPFIELATTTSRAHRGELDDVRALLSPGSAQHLGARAVTVALRNVLRELSLSRPVLLAVDDVHWADEGSVDVLAALARHPPDAGVVLLLGFRPLPVAGPLHELRPGRLGPMRNAVYRIELRELSETEVAELLPEAPSQQRRALYEMCGGNPFYLQAVHRYAGGTPRDWITGTALPAAVHTALVAELDALDPDTRTVVDAAAVLGEPFDPALVGAVLDRTLPETLSALDGSRNHHVCHPDIGHRWRFRHPLLAKATYDAQPMSTRVRTHQRAARVLAARGASSPERARHLLTAAHPGDWAAAEVLLDAADQLAGQAPRQAARWYAAALTIAPDGGRRGTVTVQLNRARALASIGELTGARDLVHAVLPQLVASDPRRLVACALAARIEHVMGRNAESAALLLRELAAAGDRTTGDVVSLHLELATTRLLGGRFTAARKTAETAQRLASPEDQPLRAHAAAVIALSAAAAGDLAAAHEQRQVGALAVDGLADAELAGVLESGIWLGWAEMFLEALPDARRHLDRCLAIARRGAHHYLLPHLLIGYGSTLKTVGELVGAAESYDEAADAAAHIASGELDTMTMAMQCRIATWLGDLDRAERLGDRAVRAASDRDNWFSAVAVAVLAQARVTAGRTGGCVDAIYGAGGGPELTGFDPASRCDWWEVVTRAALGDQDVATATDAADRADACAAGLPLHSPSGFAALAEAAVARHVHDAQRATEHASRAVDAFIASGHRLEWARARMIRGRAHADAGRRSDALADLTAAESCFAGSQARHLQRQARAALRRLGKRVAAEDPVDASVDGPLAALSQREREVAALVAKGHTSRQIAADLFVSAKTVESHLGHIFTKLGVSSRAAVAALAGAGSQHRP